MKPFYSLMNTQKTDNFLIKADIKSSNYRKILWAIVLIVSIGGIKYPLLGLPMFPMFIVILAMGLMKGRYWCGNYCPRGSFWDYPVRKFSLYRRLPSFFRSMWFRGAIMLFFVWSMTMGFMKLAGNWNDWGLWQQMGMVGVGLCMKTTILGLVLGLFVNPRSWCTFCPMGTMQKMLYKTGQKLQLNKNTDVKVSVRHENLCHKCGKCERTCQMQLSPYTAFENHQFTHADCIKCGTCTINCPAGILSIEKQTKAADNALKTDSESKVHKKRKRVLAEVVELKKLRPDTREITFRVKDDDLWYEAGQFILIQIADEPEMFRAYSISSGKSDGKHISITVKKIAKGYGTEIIFDQFTKGKEVVMEGPMGQELTIDQNDQSLVFVGGGIGITPFVPLVHEALQQAKNVKLIHGVTKKEDFIYDRHFEKLAAENAHFEYIQVANDPHFTGNRGFVTDMLEKIDVHNSGIYLCGPAPMIKATEALLHKRKVNRSRIHAESA